MALATVTWLARLSGVAFAAGSVVAAFWLGRILWDRRAGLFTAVLTALFYPQFYYGRTSNVDGPALFWAIVGMATTAAILRSGLTRRRAVALGAIAAIGVATKDANVFVFGALALVLAIDQWTKRAVAPTGERIAALAVGGVDLARGVRRRLRAGLQYRPFRRPPRLDARHASGLPVPRDPGRAGAPGGRGVRALVGRAEPAGGPGRAGGCGAPGPAGPRARALDPAAGPGDLPGTIPLVHFINFRYILVVAFVALPFAGFALAWWTREPGRQRVLGWLAVLVCVAWPLVRAGDLTHQMRHDPRTEVAAFLAEHARPGDRIGYWGSAQKLPALGPGVTPVALEAVCTAGALEALAPDFVLAIPQQHFEVDHAWTAAPRGDGGVGFGRHFLSSGDGRAGPTLADAPPRCPS